MADNNDEYSHLEQAGNHGDVLKHVVLRAVIKAQQEAHPEGILFVDTHCGPGQYDLSEQKSAEYEKGISRIANEITKDDDDDANSGVPDQIKEYWQIVKGTDEYLQIYPGSPIIAERLMRQQDEQRMCDAVVTKVEGLQNKNPPTLQNGDAFHPDAIDYFMPKTKMHPVIFIDPSYVDADDFHEAKQLMERILDKDPFATVLLWFPYIEKNRYRFTFLKSLKEMVQKKAKIGHYNAWLTVQKTGLQGSCVFCANPTKDFDEVLNEETLDWLSCILLKSGRSDYAVEQWMKKIKPAK